MQTAIAALKTLPEAFVIGHGAHSSPEDGMCVMEAIAFVAGEPFSDHPTCASPTVASFLRQFNDRLPDDETRTKLLARLIPKLVGSKGSAALEERRRWMLVDFAIRVATPRWLDLAKLTAEAATLRALPEVTAANHSEITKTVRKIRQKAVDNYWPKREARYAKIKAAVAEALKGKKWPAAAAADAAAAAAAAAAADAADADADAADAAADADAADADDADAAAAAADAAAAAAYGTNDYWAWRSKFYDQCRAIFRKRFAERLGPTIEQSRVETVEMIERVLAVTE